MRIVTRLSRAVHTELARHILTAARRVPACFCRHARSRSVLAPHQLHTKQVSTAALAVEEEVRGPAFNTWQDAAEEQAHAVLSRVLDYSEQQLQGRGVGCAKGRQACSICWLRLQAEAPAEGLGDNGQSAAEAERDQSAAEEASLPAPTARPRKHRAVQILDDSSHPLRHTDFPRSVWTCLLRLRAEGAATAARLPRGSDQADCFTCCSCAGHDGWVVGGAVRDLLLSCRPKDFDIVTTATPNQARLDAQRSATCADNQCTCNPGLRLPSASGLRNREWTHTCACGCPQALCASPAWDRQEQGRSVTPRQLRRR